MCGIVGVVRRRARRDPPDVSEVVARLDVALAAMPSSLDARAPERLAEAAVALEAADRDLSGVPGVRALVADEAGARAVQAVAVAVAERLDRLEAELDAEPDAFVLPDGPEPVNAALARARDAAWAIERDRLRTARAVADLAGAGATPAALEAFTSVQVALSAIDRLEVRGRDSAGLHVLVQHPGLDLGDAGVAARVAARAADPLFGSGSVRAVDGGGLAFVYKVAAEIGELGENTAALRAALRADDLLHESVAGPDSQAVVLAHTRWASVGVVSEANAHPLNQEEVDRPGSCYVAAALNGDVDNHADLRALEDLALAPEITTDAKVIPALVARGIDAGAGVEEAFRATAAGLEGSVAIAASAADRPDGLLLALRGSGQALYVGVAEDAYLVASEPYGLVEETSVYLRMDGETPVDPERADATRGQIVALDGAAAGDVAGIRRWSYDGTELRVTAADLVRAEITTRDIDRGDAPHFLLKEIREAPASLRKTLRARVAERDGRLAVFLGTEALPEALRAKLRDGSIRRAVVIGQGTAAVAGQSLAAALDIATAGRLRADAEPATELSGFGLRPDMRDTLVVAISQSGTTTDTNRTVDLVRARGAPVVSIVNRRNSDLVDKSDGVLYTSDGRDVEMSVASTKAFYAQIAAGFLLALAVGDELGTVDPVWCHDLLTGLLALPDAMREVVERRDEIARVAQRHVLSRRSWAVVGNGANRIAAHELRIKLSELCYKAIACDVTEDKKHIDLSSEPLVLVCAAGLTGSNAEDVAKEVAIYRAHRAAPIVVATAGGAAFPAALETIGVPATHPALGFVLSTVAGHLFGYEAALAIDASARPLREARAAIEAAAPGPPEALLERLAPELDGPARRFFDGLRAGSYDGTLEASTAVRVGSLLRYATGAMPLDSYEVEHGAVGTPGGVAADLTVALTRAVDELTRPVDAIKHQAKTVTVGISRADESLLQVPLVRQVLQAGAPRDGLTYRALRTLVDLDPAVEEVVGFTRYRIEGDPGADPGATVHVVDRGGIATEIPSRTEREPALRGTKHRVATQREVTAVKGRRDGRTMVMVPEVKHNQTVGLTLLHVRFAHRLPPEVARAVLRGYQGRYAALHDAVTETEPVFDEAILGETPVVDLLTEPVYVLADRWRRSGA